MRYVRRLNHMNINGKGISPVSDGKLRIAVSPRALFDMSREDTLFENEGLDTYRDYQLGHLDQPYGKGVAYNFIERILNFNSIGEDTGTKGHGSLVEVIVMSHMDPSTGVRVMRTIKHYGLDVYQSVFSSGSSLTPFIASMGVSLYLSTDEESVREALDAGFPAGRVMGPITAHDDPNGEVRIAFDFDGVLADDSSEHRFATEGLSGFCDHEYRHAFEPMRPGPLLPFLESLGHVQKAELAYKSEHPDYRRRLKIAICTARGMPSDVRVIKSLEHWGINVDIACFRDGCEKAPFLKGFDASLFFDDQLRHIDAAEQYVPSVHVPFGVKNVEKSDKRRINAADADNDTADINGNADGAESSDASTSSSGNHVIVDLTDGDNHDENYVVLPDGRKFKIDENEQFDINQFKPCFFQPHDKAIYAATNDDIKTNLGKNCDDLKSNEPNGAKCEQDKNRRFADVLDRVMKMVWIDKVEETDGIGGVYFKRPQNDGSWNVDIDPDSPAFGLFSPACECDSPNLVLSTGNEISHKAYHSIVNGDVDCVSTGGLGSVVLSDIDNDAWNQNQAVRTLVARINRRDVMRAELASSEAIRNVGDELPDASIFIRYSMIDDNSDNDVVTVMFKTTAQFRNAPWHKLAHTNAVLAKTNTEMADIIQNAVSSADIVSSNIESETAYRIADAIINFDRTQMRIDKVQEIVNQGNAE